MENILKISRLIKVHCFPCICLLVSQDCFAHCTHKRSETLAYNPPYRTLNTHIQPFKTPVNFFSCSAHLAESYYSMISGGLNTRVTSITHSMSMEVCTHTSCRDSKKLYALTKAVGTHKSCRQSQKLQALTEAVGTHKICRHSQKLQTFTKAVGTTGQVYGLKQADKLCGR